MFPGLHVMYRALTPDESSVALAICVMKITVTTESGGENRFAAGAWIGPP